MGNTVLFSNLLFIIFLENLDGTKTLPLIKQEKQNTKKEGRRRTPYPSWNTSVMNPSLVQIHNFMLSNPCEKNG